MSAKCSSCGALIAWGITERGKRMPLDAEPSTKGTMAFDGQTIRVASAEDRKRGTALYLSHFATCPFAAQHRRPR